ncbi:hypothetical protein MHU86_6759 [Fragilaria crotonensis]|nr:hypothetical protein MHU86_6759 [Fragilaria crotonensis]
MTEKEYRDSTTPTLWHRYITLGRYVVDGFTFDSIMEDGVIDPLKMHCLVWYQYAYHLDQKIDIPPKLQAWGATRSQPYLAKHADSAFKLDTNITTWKEFSQPNLFPIRGLKFHLSRTSSKSQSYKDFCHGIISPLKPFQTRHYC